MSSEKDRRRDPIEAVRQISALPRLSLAKIPFEPREID